jgi:hypothetical protein
LSHGKCKGSIIEALKIIYETLMRVRSFLNHHHAKDVPKGPRAFRSTIKEVSIQKHACTDKKFCSQAGPSGLAVISLQKADSAIILDVTGS